MYHCAPQTTLKVVWPLLSGHDCAIKNWIDIRLLTRKIRLDKWGAFIQLTSCSEKRCCHLWNWNVKYQLLFSMLQVREFFCIVSVFMLDHSGPLPEMSGIFFFGYEKHVFFSFFLFSFLRKTHGFYPTNFISSGALFSFVRYAIIVRVVQFWVTGYNKVFNGGSVLALFISVTLREQRG